MKAQSFRQSANCIARTRELCISLRQRGPVCQQRPLATKTVSPEIPNVLPKKNTKFVYLTSYNSIIGKDVPNWEYVTSELRRYYQKEDTKRAFKLANRIVNRGLSPPPKVVELILAHLARLDYNISSEVMLTIFENAIEAGEVLSPQALSTLIWMLRRTKNAFVRAASIELFERYMEGKPNMEKLTLSVQLAYLHSVAEAADVEETWRVWKKVQVDQLSPELLKQVPWTTITDLFMQKNRQHGQTHFSVEIIRAMNDAGVIVPPRTWHSLLEHCINTRHVDGAEFVWYSAIQPNKIQPTVAALRSLVDLFSDADGSNLAWDVLQKLTFYDPNSAVAECDFPVALDAFLTTPHATISGGFDLLRLFKSLQLFAQNFPSVEVRDLRGAGRVFWNLVLAQELTPLEVATTLVESNRAYFDSSPELLTLVMNFLLQTCNDNFAVPVTVDLYFELLSQGIVPNQTTFELLAYTSMLSKGSKLFGNVIYQECQTRGLPVSDAMYAYLLRGTLRGRDFSSALYYVSRLDSPQKQLSSSLLDHIQRSFDRVHDGRLRELLASPEVERAKYTEFTPANVLAKSSSKKTAGWLAYDYSLDRTMCRRIFGQRPLPNLSAS